MKKELADLKYEMTGMSLDDLRIISKMAGLEIRLRNLTKRLADLKKKQFAAADDRHEWDRLEVAISNTRSDMDLIYEQRFANGGK